MDNGIGVCIVPPGLIAVLRLHRVIGFPVGTMARFADGVNNGITFLVVPPRGLPADAMLMPTKVGAMCTKKPSTIDVDGCLSRSLFPLREFRNGRVQHRSRRTNIPGEGMDIHFPDLIPGAKGYRPEKSKINVRRRE
jgi:hypothetical protein